MWIQVRKTYVSTKRTILEIDQLNEIADYTKIKGFRVEKLYLDIARLSRIFGAERTTGYPVNQKNLNILKIMKKMLTDQTCPLVSQHL